MINVKKFLLSLGAIGLVAVAGASVVSCTGETYRRGDTRENELLYVKIGIGENERLVNVYFINYIYKDKETGNWIAQLKDKDDKIVLTGAQYDLLAHYLLGARARG